MRNELKKVFNIAINAQTVPLQTEEVVNEVYEELVGIMDNENYFSELKTLARESDDKRKKSLYRVAGLLQMNQDNPAKVFNDETRYNNTKIEIDYFQ